MLEHIKNKAVIVFVIAVLFYISLCFISDLTSFDLLFTAIVSLVVIILSIVAIVRRHYYYFVILAFSLFYLSMLGYGLYVELARNQTLNF